MSKGMVIIACVAMVLLWLIVIVATDLVTALVGGS
jgi:hypothetical protein